MLNTGELTDWQLFLSGAKVLLCGNFGSAPDWQHMAAELVSHFSKDLDGRVLPGCYLASPILPFRPVLGMTVDSKGVLSDNK